MAENRKDVFFVMDILKFVFCIFVIGIHCEIFTENQILRYWVEKGLFRLAVPYFMLSSGFLLARKIDENLGDVKKSMVQFSKRLLEMLVIFEPLAIVFQGTLLKINQESGTRILLKTIRSVIFYPPGALWYIQAILVGAWILYSLQIKGIHSKIIGFISASLFLFALLCNSYYFVIEDTPIATIVELYLRVAASARNGIFYGLFMMWLGKQAYRFYRKARIDSVKLLIGVLFCYGLYLIEIGVLRGRKMEDDGSIFFMMIPTCFLLLLLSTNLKTSKRKTVVFRNLSTGMYLLHRQVLYVLTIICNLTSFFFTYEVQFILVTLLSMLICLVSYRKAPRLSRILK